MTETSQPPKQGGKGRPTPKRSEAEKARKKPLVAAKGKAAPRDRSTRANLRREMREAMRTGDERLYPPMHAGPEKAVVRDAVDGRRSVGWVALPGWAVGMALTLVENPVAQTVAAFLFMLVFGALILDSILAGRAVRRALAEHFPNGTEASRKSLVWHGVARNTQFRRQRLPRPRVGPGS